MVGYIKHIVGKNLGPHLVQGNIEIEERTWKGMSCANSPKASNNGDKKGYLWCGLEHREISTLRIVN